MRLHLCALPHAVTCRENSHYPFSGKILRFSPMMRSVGYEVVHYGIEGATSGANEQVDLLTSAELDAYLGPPEPKAGFRGLSEATDSPLYRLFNARLGAALERRVAPGDAICLPYGHAHADALAPRPSLRRAFWVETGIGYETTFADYRVYESAAWRAWHAGRAERDGSDYEWVIPNYFDLTEWSTSYEAGSYLLYFGRLLQSKGLDVVREIAKARPDLDIVICGQGDPVPWLGLPNVRHLPPVRDAERSRLLGGALALLCPSRYVEPFGSVAVEAMLCGTPVLSSDFGAFPETVEQGVSGYRCHTLGDWLSAVERVSAWREAERRAVRCSAERFDMVKLAPRYRAVFEQLQDLGGAGWFSPRSHLALPQET